MTLTPPPMPRCPFPDEHATPEAFNHAFGTYAGELILHAQDGWETAVRLDSELSGKTGELNALHAQVETAKTEERERILQHLWEGPYLIRMRTEAAMDDPYPEEDDYEDLDNEKSFSRLRDALAKVKDEK